MKKTANPVIRHGDKEQTLSAWAKELEISRQGLWNRLQRLPVADALRDKAGRQTVYQRENCTWILIDGKAFTVGAAAAHFAVTDDTIRRWVREKRLELYRNGRVRHCSHCQATDHQLNQCPELHLKPGKRRLPGSPPPRSKLRAAGILPKAPPGEDKLEL